jgi:hypothetical protein
MTGIITEGGMKGNACRLTDEEASRVTQALGRALRVNLHRRQALGRPTGKGATRMAREGA